MLGIVVCIYIYIPMVFFSAFFLAAFFFGCFRLSRFFMIFLGSSNAARYVCWNHVKAHPAMRHSWRIAQKGTGKATKKSTETQIAQERDQNSSNTTIWSRGKNWTLILTDQCSTIGNGTSCLLSNKMFSVAGWENGHFFVQSFYIKWRNSITSFFNDVQFAYLHVYAVKSEHYTLKFMPILGGERERELHSSHSKSFKTWYIPKNSQIFPACTSIFIP